MRVPYRISRISSVEQGRPSASLKASKQSPPSRTSSRMMQALRSRAIAKLLIAVLVGTLSVPVLSTDRAEAWNGYPRFAKGSTIDYCFNPNSGWTSTVLSTLRAAIRNIDDNASALTMREVFNGNSCHQWVYAASNLKITFDSTDCAIMCYVVSYNALGPAKQEIRINPHKLMSWGTGIQNCRQSTTVRCLPYAFGAFQHEVMHWLGFEHTGFPGRNLGSCSYNGFMSNQTASACDAYGQRLMFAAAADGYWRVLGAPSGDDLYGLNLNYDW